MERRERLVSLSPHSFFFLSSPEVGLMGGVVSLSTLSLLVHEGETDVIDLYHPFVFLESYLEGIHYCSHQ
jgi:hypothetical protein